MTKFILDSGDPKEYKEIAQLLKEKGSELWGSTTNPSLIAKTLTGKKVTQDEAFYTLQKQIIQEILTLVPGAVSAEVYASKTTTAPEMIAQGKEIATWDKRVVVKLPTTLEGFKARTELRKLGICINNTLVFSQQQAFAITLHEKIMRENFGLVKSSYPPFISPFVGRLDDIGQDGMSMIKHSIDIINKNYEPNTVWMLEASIRNVEHLKAGLDLNIDLVTVPAKVYVQWFALSDEQKVAIKTTNPTLQEIPAWQPSDELLQIKTVDAFLDAITNGSLDITHPLTDKGVDRFVADWSAIII